MISLADLIEQKAHKDGQYAIAYAVLELTHYVRDLGFGTSTIHPGAIEKIGMELAVIGKALASIAEHFSSPDA